jgi:exodeoxyribonuclease VII large subunit
MHTELMRPEPEVTYAPSAVLQLFNNALMAPQAKKLILLKGVFVPGRGQNYNGYYYDSLRDESSDACLTLVMPGLIRNRLSAGKTITFYGYVTKKVVANGGRIELQIHISELLGQQASRYTDDEIKALHIQQQKAALGYRDAHFFIKERILAGQSLRIVVLIGRTAIIDSDIKHQLAETLHAYNFDFQRINLASEQEIIRAIDQHDHDGTDLLVISRGGGEQLEIFNKPDIAARCLKLKPYLLTAIGHKEDVTLLQRIADKAFITPTALGQYLNDLYQDTVAGLEASRAHLVEQVKTQLSTGYEQQLKALREQMNEREQLQLKSQEQQEALDRERLSLLEGQLSATQRQQQDREALSRSQQQELQRLHSQLSSMQSRPAWWVVLAAVIAGLIIGILILNISR